MKILTERLVIRRMAETDLHDFLAYQTHPDNLKYVSGEPFSEEKAAAYLTRQAAADIDDAAFEGWAAFALELADSRRMIGEVGVYLTPTKKAQGDIGWSLHPDYRGHGYATEAAHALLAYLFGERALHRVTAGCDARNHASLRLMERLGMRREGHFRQSHFADNVWQDDYLYALLREEWLICRQASQKESIPDPTVDR